MPPSSSPPLASGLLGLSSSPAQTPSIPHPGNFRQPPATTALPTDFSPPFEETDEFSLLARLEQKRREIEAEIGVFRIAKEAEYRELEKQLREEQKSQSNKKRKRENGGARSVSGGGKEQDTDATHATAGVTLSDDGDTGFTGKGHKVGSINYGALGLGDSKPNDTLKLEFPDCQKQIGFDGSSVSSVSNSSCTTTSPPFEKELQAAGLFTPRYLPLLDDNYFRPTSPPTSSMPQDPSTSETQTLPQQVMPKLANIPSSSSRAGNTSPAYPLASSLKSSSGSSTSTMSKSGTTKQKSPKRVTFQFEDEDSVPSRSSPPPTKVHWTLENENYALEDDGFVEYEGEEVDEDGSGEKGKLEQTEQVTIEAMVGGRFPGDELVVPTTVGGGAPGVVQKSSGFDGLGISGIPGPTNGTNGDNGDSNSDDELTSYDDDDDEVALFDLDETIPEVKDDPSPPRDYSALTNSPQTVTNARLTASSFPMLPSFTPSVPTVPSSASQSILTFGKSPGPRPGLPRVRRGSLSSSLSPLTKQAQFQQEPIASSLPNFGWKGADPPKTGFVPTPGGRFRRRSIVKYDLAEDEVASFKGKGKGKETQRAISEASDEEDDVGFSLSKSPNATSLPMSISRLSPAAFAAMSNKSRPQKPPTQLVTNNDIPDPAPVTARPSPKLRSPLSAAASFPVQPIAPKMDSADILASMPSSFTMADNASPEKNDSVSSYRRSSPFPSAYDRTPYRTVYAAEVAAAAALDDEADYGGALESVVGGVDGRTGLDPDISSSYRASSLGPGGGSRGRSGSLAGAMEAINPGRMSFGMRMAWESGKKEEVVKRK